MDPTYAHAHAHALPAHAPPDADELQRMWQFLDSSLSTPNGVPPPNAGASQGPGQGAQPPQHPHPHPHPQTHGHGHSVGHAHGVGVGEGDAAAPPLNDDELGDVFNMFFNLDTEDVGAHAHAHAHAGAGAGVDASGKVQLARNLSAGSAFGDGSSPAHLLGYPSMSPATMNWLQSLARSPSSESLTGLVSPATMSFSGGSAGGLSVIESGSAQGGMTRSPSCETIDWKAYNDAVGMAENAQKDAPKWRVIPQHGPHADAVAGAAAGSAQYQGGNAAPGTKPPPGSAPAQLGGGATPNDSGLRNHFSRQFQTIKSTVVSLVGALGSTDATASTSTAQQQAQQLQTQQPGQQASGLLPPDVQQQYELAAQRMADEKNKRKAIISPEYVQYGSDSSVSSGASSMPAVSVLPYPSASDPVKFEPVPNAPQYSQVPDPNGRRPSKKSLHQTGHEHNAHGPGEHGSTAAGAAIVAGLQTSALANVKEEPGLAGGPVRCKCTGKCRNARCACVKAGFVCGVHCKCVSCANPFVPMEKAGINIQTMVNDVCLMQYLSKVKDMEELLDSTVPFECCNGVVQVKHTVENGFACPKCQAHYTYSWCSNRLCHDQKKPRKHCAKCRRCGDHRNEHCDDCNHCYFAGVANSFSCSCKSGKSSGSGVKSRSVIPNVAGSSDESSPSSSANAKSVAFQPDGARAARGDENTNPQTGGGGANGASSTTIAAGLSNSDAEKDDACPVQ